MSFDNHFGLGAIVEILVLLLGLAGGWATLKVTQKVTLEQLKTLGDGIKDDRERNDRQHEDNLRRFQDIDRQIARDCVKMDDFRRLDDRFTTKMEKLEHVIRNVGMNTAGAVKDALREVLNQRGGRAE